MIAKLVNVENSKDEQAPIVVADTIGAGVGETVILCCGSGAIGIALKKNKEYEESSSN